MAVIVYENISKTFDGGKTYAVDGVSAEIEKGEFVTILGSSGCGKTTLLKLTNRLYEPDGGRILVEGKDTSGLDPVRLRRSMGYVIQQVGLFPHMTVEGNITAVPSLMKWDKGRMKERADQLLRLVGLEPSEFRDRYPHQLSGGQQQRIGLARALVLDPDIMLMDEPFGALDAVTKALLQDTVLDLWSKETENRKTVFFVTHSVDEALLLATDILVLGQAPSKIIYTHHFTPETKPTRETLYTDPDVRDLREKLTRIINEEIQEKARRAKEAREKKAAEQPRKRAGRRK